MKEDKIKEIFELKEEFKMSCNDYLKIFNKTFLKKLNDNDLETIKNYLEYAREYIDYDIISIKESLNEIF